MNLETSPQGTDAIVIRCDGRLTMATAPALKAAVAATITDERPRVVVDLTGIAFVDSSGLGALVSGLKATRQAGGDLRIVGVGDQVRTVLSLTNLDRVLHPYDKIEDATHAW
ncbi:MAG: STAS domain-containing protein [Terracoccus sp.]